MPIIIPTIDEIERMDSRQLSTMRKRLKALRKAVDRSMHALGETESADIDQWASNVAARFLDEYRSFDMEKARIILAKIGPDVNAPENMWKLEKAIEVKGRKRNE